VCRIEGRTSSTTTKTKTSWAYKEAATETLSTWVRSPNRLSPKIMAKVLAVALGRSGAMVTPVKLSPSLSKAEAIRALQSTDAGKSLLLLLYEWKSDTYKKSDTYNGTEIIYELEMEAIDKQGKVRARKRAQRL